jgi:hypothetical protein
MNLRTLIIILTSALLAPVLQAQSVIGSIGFGSLGGSVGGGDFATASSFTLNSPFITTETGVYTGAPLLTPITYNGFQFNPAVSSVTPLWTFNVGAINYSFDVTSMTSFYDATLHQWDIGGNGTALVTGHTPTPAIWNVDLSQSGASIVFDSTAAAVPEPSILVLIGGGFVGLAGFFRKPKGQVRR